MNPSQKRDIRIIVSMVVVFVLGVVYYQVYTSPALRYGHTLYLLKCSTDSMKEYQTQNQSIRIVKEGDNTEITFQNAAGTKNRFMVTESNYTLRVFDQGADMVLAGIWRGDCLYDFDGSKNGLYASFLSEQNRFYLSDTYQPQAADALFIYKTYPTSKRGKRGPLILVGLFSIMGILLGEIDSPVTIDSLPFRERFRYSEALLQGNDKEEGHGQTKQLETSAAWIAAFACLIGVILLIGDLFCY